MMKKRCSKCRKLKSRDEFHKQSASKDGLRSHCKTCIAGYNRIKLERRNPNAKKHLKYSRAHRIINGEKQKHCPKCKRWKSINEFYKNRIKKDGFNSHCKNCYQVYKRSSKGKTINAENCKKYRRTIKGNLCDRFWTIYKRCNNSNDINWKCYGVRGIQCKFEDAYDFTCYVMGVLGFNTYDKIKNLEIHRNNNNGHYEMGNIEFLTPEEHRARHRAMRKD